MSPTLGAIAVRVAVLQIFAPTQVVLDGGGQRHELALREGALIVDGHREDRVRVTGAPTVGVEVIERGHVRIARRFRGVIEAWREGDEIRLIDELPDEDYLPGTVALEAGGQHPEALKVQAVLARTFVARGSRHGPAFALCDLTHCQTYRGVDGESGAAAAAVSATRGEILVEGARPADVHFTATCGGATADPAEVWPAPGTPGTLHGRSVRCDACLGSPDFSWHADPRLVDVAAALGAPRLTGLTVLARGAGELVLRVRLDGDGRIVGGEALRVALGRALGWQVIRSARFRVDRRGDRLRFDGRGYGHLAGLCEAGAAERARRGAGYREILGHYFPAAELRPAH